MVVRGEGGWHILQETKEGGGSSNSKQCTIAKKKKKKTKTLNMLRPETELGSGEGGWLEAVVDNQAIVAMMGRGAEG